MTIGAPLARTYTGQNDFNIITVIPDSAVGYTFVSPRRLDNGPPVSLSATVVSMQQAQMSFHEGLSLKGSANLMELDGKEMDIPHTAELMPDDRKMSRQHLAILTS